MTRFDAIPGQTLEVEVDPDGWPFTVTIGNTPVTGWPERRRKGTARPTIAAYLSFRVPALGTGVHQLVVADRTGPVLTGSIVIP